MIRLRNLPLLAVVLLSLNACDSVQPYAATVNGERISSSDIQDFYRAYRALDPSANSAALHGSAAISQNLNNPIIQRLVAVKAMENVLKSQGVKFDVDSVAKFESVLQPSEKAAFRKVPLADRKLVSDAFVLPAFFNAVDAGVKPSTSAVVTCGLVAQFTTEESATAAAKSAKSGGELSSEQGFPPPSEDCYAGVGNPVNDLDAALRGASVGAVVGPVSVQVPGQFGTQTVYEVAKVTSNETLAFNDWPLRAIQNLTSSTAGKLTKKLFDEKVKVNPAYGRLASTQQDLLRCGNSPICILPPVDPTQPSNALQ
jgi:hypothetical protein